MNEIQKQISEQLVKRDLESPSLSQQIIWTAERVDDKEKLHYEHENVAYAMSDVEYERFQKKQYEERCRKFEEEEGPFDRYDNRAELFMNWEKWKYGKNTYPAEPVGTSNPISFTPPTVAVTCGAAKFTKAPLRPSEVRKEKVPIFNIESNSEAVANKSPRIQNKFLKGRLVTRLSEMDKKEKNASSKLSGLIEERLRLEEKADPRNSSHS